MSQYFLQGARIEPSAESGRIHEVPPNTIRRSLQSRTLIQHSLLECDVGTRENANKKFSRPLREDNFTEPVPVVFCRMGRLMPIGHARGVQDIADWLDDDRKVHPCNFESAYAGFEIMMAMCRSAVEGGQIALPLTTAADELQALSARLAGRKVLLSNAANARNTCLRNRRGKQRPLDRVRHARTTGAADPRAHDPAE